MDRKKKFLDFDRQVLSANAERRAKRRIAITRIDQSGRGIFYP
jgi:hypothetical protein